MKVRKNANITEQMLKGYEEYFRGEEQGGATIGKYIQGVRKFLVFLPEDKGTEKEVVQEYREWLRERYRITSANSILAAVSSFFVLLGREEFKVKLYKIQRMTYSRPEREITERDYMGLVKAAKADGDERMSMPLQTIGNTGIRINELELITIDAVNTGKAEIYNKGKSWVVLLPAELTRLLKAYCREAGIGTGSIFVTKNGKPMDKSNIGKRMKQPGIEAGVDVVRILPRNLRRLFARIFCSIEKDVVRLVDLPGHPNISAIRIYTVAMEEQPRRQMARVHLVLGWLGNYPE